MIKYVLIGILCLYIVLMIAANVTNKQIKAYSKGLSLVGCAISLLYIITIFFGYNIIILLVIGLALIIGAGICNGFAMYGKLHIKHHVIRIIFSIILTALFWLYAK